MSTHCQLYCMVLCCKCLKRIVSFCWCFSWTWRWTYAANLLVIFYVSYWHVHVGCTFQNILNDCQDCASLLLMYFNMGHHVSLLLVQFLLHILKVVMGDSAKKKTIRFESVPQTSRFDSIRFDSLLCQNLPRQSTPGVLDSGLKLLDHRPTLQ